MISYMDFTSPDVQFFYDLRSNRFMTKDSRNYINALGRKQLNTLGDVSLLDIFLSKSNIVEPHLHQNASELVYLVSGSAVVSLINPFTKKLINIPLQPQQVANVPQGWWHYEIATADDTHILAIFDAPYPEFIGGSDILRLTPAEILSHSYCLDEAKIKEALAPIQGTVVIGPPNDCKLTPAGQVQGMQAAANLPLTGTTRSASAVPARTVGPAAYPPPPGYPYEYGPAYYPLNYGSGWQPGGR